MRTSSASTRPLLTRPRHAENDWPHRAAERVSGTDKYYNSHRPHRSLGQRAPNNHDVVGYQPSKPIRRHAACGGLINEYRQVA